MIEARRASITSLYGSSSSYGMPATGGWNQPTAPTIITLRKSTWDLTKPASYITIDGSVDLDAGCFYDARGRMQEYSITIALTSPTGRLDWNTEGASPRNPYSGITIHPRLTIDADFSSAKFTINVPAKFFEGGRGEVQFGIAAKAFACGNPMLATPAAETGFVIRNRVGVAEKRMSRR